MSGNTSWWQRISAEIKRRNKNRAKFLAWKAGDGVVIRCLDARAHEQIGRREWATSVPSAFETFVARLSVPFARRT